MNKTNNILEGEGREAAEIILCFMKFLEYSTDILTDAGKMNTVHLYSNLVNSDNKII